MSNFRNYKLFQWIRAATLLIILTGVNGFSAPLTAPAPFHVTTDLNSQIQLVYALAQRHSDFFSSHLQFKRNPFDTIRSIPDVLHMLGPQDTNPDIYSLNSSHQMMVRGAFSGHFSFDQKAIEEVKSDLQLNLKKISEKQISEKQIPLTSLEVDFPKVLEAGVVGPWLRLLPLIYDIQGQGIATNHKDLEAAINLLTPASLSNLYSDLSKSHLIPLIESKDTRWLQELSLYEKKFIKNIQRATQTKFSNQLDEKSLRTLTLEPLTITSISRNHWGGDCSAYSAPYFGLVKGVEVLGIKIGNKEKGYVLLTEVPHPEKTGKVIPYVITVNGISLDGFDVALVTEAVAQKYQTSEIVVPDFNYDQNGEVLNHALTNTEVIRGALSYDVSKKVVVSLSEGWSKMATYQQKNSNGYSNYYDPNRIEHARLVDLMLNQNRRPKTLDYAEIANPGYYFIPKDISKLDLKARAVLAHYAVQSQKGIKQENLISVTNLLGVNLRQMVVAGKLAEASAAHPIDYDNFKAMNAELGLSLDDVSRLDPYTAAASLGKIYKAGFYLSKNWSVFTKRISAKLVKEEEELEILRRNILTDTYEKMLNDILAAQLALPFNESFYPEVLKALFGNHKYAVAFSFRTLEIPTRLWQMVEMHLKSSHLDEKQMGWLAVQLKHNNGWPETIQKKIIEIYNQLDHHVSNHGDTFRPGAIQRDILGGFTNQNSWSEDTWEFMLRILPKITQEIKYGFFARKPIPTKIVSKIPGTLEKFEPNLQHQFLQGLFIYGEWDHGRWDLAEALVLGKEKYSRVLSYLSVSDRPWPQKFILATTDFARNPKNKEFRELYLRQTLRSQVPEVLRPLALKCGSKILQLLQKP